MNGPSLDAIRKFKELQARKKEEEKLKFNESKLSTLEHRAAQGDKKAKRQLKDLEQAKVDQNAREAKEALRKEKERERKNKINEVAPPRPHVTKEVRKDYSFEELMQIAKKNKNLPNLNNPDKTKPTAGKTKQQPISHGIAHTDSELFKCDQCPKTFRSKPDLKIHQDGHKGIESFTCKFCEKQLQSYADKLKHELRHIEEKKYKCNACDKAFIEKEELKNHLKVHLGNQKSITSSNVVKAAQPSSSTKTSMTPINKPSQITSKINADQAKRPLIKTSQQIVKSNIQKPRHSGHISDINRRRRYDDYYDDEDEYDELDDFIDDGDDDDAQLELSKTLKSVFGYDRQKYAKREALLDAQAEREYRAIGKVQTFEDLEREERRSAKLAAREDKIAEREEEERRAKKLKMKSRG